MYLQGRAVRFVCVFVLVVVSRVCDCVCLWVCVWVCVCVCVGRLVRQDSACVYFRVFENVQIIVEGKRNVLQSSNGIYDNEIKMLLPN